MAQGTSSPLGLAMVKQTFLPRSFLNSLQRPRQSLFLFARNIISSSNSDSTGMLRRLFLLSHFHPPRQSHRLDMTRPRFLFLPHRNPGWEKAEINISSNSTTKTIFKVSGDLNRGIHFDTLPYPFPFQILVVYNDSYTIDTRIPRQGK